MIQIDNYTIDELWYQSNLSVIYRGYQHSTGRPVFVKTVTSSQTSQNELLEIKREYELLKLFDSDKIIKPLDLVRSNSGLVMIVEDFGGRDLNYFTSVKVLPLIQCLKIARDVALGLNEIHGKNIIHKDISPGNLIYNQETEQVKVIDFGISSRLERESQDICSQGGLEGNLSYISPEQTGRTARDLDYRTDFYSLGATLYELFTGKLMFKEEDEASYIHSHLARVPDRIDRINAKIPKTVADIVEKLLSKNMEDRYQSSWKLAADLTRCVDELEKNSSVSDFKIATGDICEKFTLPQRLIGRDKEVESLLSSFHRAASGTKEVLTIGGFSGIGKSRLIAETRKPIALKNAIFIKGKFDQFTKNVPYSALAQAIDKNLADFFLRQDEDVFQSWRVKLKKVLGSNAAFVTNLSPRMEKVIDHIDPLPEMNPLQAQSQFYYSITSLFEAVASQDHPLVLVLDDMQWCDDASLDLIRAILNNENQKYLLLICAYRHNEVSANHPFTELIDHIKDRIRVNQLSLNPLSSKAITSLVAETLHQSEDLVANLAEDIYLRTEGNPYFASEYLRSLFYNQVIEFDRQNGSWTYTIEKVLSHTAPASMLDFMMAKLHDLSSPTVDALKEASCIGSQFSLVQLASIIQKPIAEVCSLLDEAINSGLISPLNEAYRLLTSAADAEFILEQDLDFRFQHDKIQQACFELISEEDRPTIHLKIARILSKQDHMNNAQKIELVRHYNIAFEYVKESSEKYLLLTLNLDGCEIAMEAGAHHIAYTYSKVAHKLFEMNATISDYDFVKRYYLLLTLSAFYDGRKDEGSRIYPDLVKHCKTNIEKAHSLFLIGQAYESYTDWTNSSYCFRKAYRFLGKNIPNRVNPIYLMYLYLRIKNLSLTEEYLQELPEASESEQLQIAILERIGQNYHQLNDPVHFIYAAMNVITCMARYGKSRYTHVAMMTLYQYVVLSSIDGPSKRTSGLVELTQKVLKSDTDSFEKSRAVFVYMLMYFQALDGDPLDAIKWSISIARKTGDFMSLASSLSIYGTCELHGTVQNRINALERYQSEMEGLNSHNFIYDSKFYAAFLERIKNEVNTARDLEKALEMYNKIETRGNRSSCMVVQARTYLIEGEFEESFKWAKEAEPNIMSVRFFLWEVSLVVMSFMSRSSLIQKKGLITRISMRLMMTLSTIYISRRFKINPKRFRCFKSLLDAEWSKIKHKNTVETLKLYEQASEDAESYSLEWVFITKLQTFRYCIERGTDFLSYNYLIQSIDSCRAWGAYGVATKLEKEFSPLLYKFKYKNMRNFQGGKSFSRTDSLKQETISIKSQTVSSSHNFDSEMILRIARSLSTEIQMKDLLVAFIDALSQHVGATKAVFLMRDDETKEFYIEAYKLSVDQPSKVVRKALSNSDMVPSDLIEKMTRIEETLIVDDASLDHETKNSPWIKEHQTKSLFIAPLENRGNSIGFIYLENETMTASFTPARVAIVRMLASQAAISIENSKLYETLEERIKEQTQEIHSIMSHIEQGIFIVQRNGHIGEHYSTHLENIFETRNIENLHVSDLLFKDSYAASDTISLLNSALLSCLGEDLLCYEINEHCFISELVIKRRDVSKVLAVDWSPIIGDNSVIDRILVSVRDVTAIKNLEKETRAGKEELDMVGQILSIVESTFHEFLKSCRNWIQEMKSICQSSILDDGMKASQIFVHLHTMKGLVRSLNLSMLATIVHDSEQTIQEIRDGLISWDTSLVMDCITDVESSYQRYETIANEKLNRDQRKVHHLESLDKIGQWVDSLRAVDERYNDNDLKILIQDMVKQYYISEEDLFIKIFSNLSSLAEELEKDEPTVDFSFCGVCFPPQTVSLLQYVFTHLINNSLDHGIEFPKDRSSKGKPTKGCMMVDLSVDDFDWLNIEFYDDGAGLNLKKIAETAISRRLISDAHHLSPSEISELICASGFSTKSEVTEVSGRGVGMDAVKSYLEAQEGKLHLVLTGGEDLEIRPFKLIIKLPPSSYFRMKAQSKAS